MAPGCLYRPVVNDLELRRERSCFLLYGSGNSLFFQARVEVPFFVGLHSDDQMDAP